MQNTQAPHALFASMFEAAGTMSCLLDTQHRIAQLNPFGARLLGTELPDALGKDFIYGFLPVSERERVSDLLTLTATTSEPQNTVFPIITGQGQARMLGVTLARVPGPDGIAGVVMNAQDLTPFMLERKQAELDARQNEVRLESLLRIAQLDVPSEQALLDHSLDEAIALTGSTIGYIYLYDETAQKFTLNTWSKGVMRACSIVAPRTQYDLNQTGIWGEVVRQGKPIVVNDFAAPNPLKRGYPPGHAPLRRFLSIPVRSGAKIVAVLGVANKRAEYENADVRQLTLLMNAVWRIVEQRRTEVALQQNASMLNLALRAARMGYWHLDFSTAQCSFDAQAAQLLGLEPADFHGSADELLGTVHPEDRGKVLESFHRATAEGLACEVEYRVVGADGQARDLCIRGAVAYDPNGLAIRLDGVLWEIGERKRAQEIDERLRVSFEKGAVPQALITIDGRFLRVNDAFAKVLGYTRGELEGHAFSEFTHPDDHGLDAIALQDLLNGADRAHLEKRYLSKDGALVWIDLNVGPVRSPEGQIRYFTASFIDITERRRAREALEESENNFRTFFESLTDMVLVADLEGRILLANTALSQTLGYSRQELLLKRALDLYPTDRRPEAERLFSCIVRGEKETCPLPMAAKDGRVIAVDTRVWRGKWSGSDCIFCRSEDLTADREAQQRFEHLFRNNPAVMTLWQPEPQLPAWLAGVRILVVDGNATNRDMVKALLEAWNMRPSGAPDGEGAVLHLGQAAHEGDPFQVLVIDHQMPGMDGRELGRRVLTDGRLSRPALILMTSLGRQEEARRLIDSGFASFLVKPLNQSSLLQCLSEALKASKTGSGN